MKKSIVTTRQLKNVGLIIKRHSGKQGNYPEATVLVELNGEIVGHYANRAVAVQSDEVRRLVYGDEGLR